MNIPIPTWLLLIVVEGRIHTIKKFTAISLPSNWEVDEIALQAGFSKFTDYQFIMVDDGRSQ